MSTPTSTPTTPRPPIRTITLGIGDPHPLDAATLDRAAAFLVEARERATAAGYEVQTTRIATRPLLAGLAEWEDAALLDYAARLQAMCATREIAYCSLGPAPADEPTFPLARVKLLPAMLADAPALSATVQLASAGKPPHFAAALATAQAMRELAERSAGEANFRFAAMAMCAPGGPFFPQAYAEGQDWWVSVGLQGAGVARAAVEELARQGVGDVALAQVSAAIAQALAAVGGPVVALVRGLAEARDLTFGGIDLSPAPMGEDSIVAAMEAAMAAVGLGCFGTPGTLAVAAAFTAGIQGTTLPTCGYTGLMLPVLEDALLGARAAEGLVSISSLLSWSAVCGTGLDTVPIPGATPPERVAAILLDMAGLAHRLRKPLSARLFLVPAGRAGEMTRFSSPYLTNTKILPVE